MSWHPNDLLTDADLRDYEANILSQFGETSWLGKRTKALEDWLWPTLQAQGFTPNRLRTRHECDQVWGYTGSAYTDYTSASKDTTADDINLATVFATPASDVLYIGSAAPFRGVFLSLLDSVSSAAGVMSVAYWNGNWEPFLIADGTIQTSGKTLSAGGSVSWLLPPDWATRKVNSSASLYFVKVTVSAVPTSAKAGQIGVIRASCLRAPVTFRTLELIMREAPTGADGPWIEKANYYAEQAERALTRALQIAGGEFETDDPPTDLISAEEGAQTPAEAGGGWRLERA